MGNLLRRDRVKAMHLEERLVCCPQEKTKRLLIVRRRVHVEIKAGIVQLAKRRTGRQCLKEFFKSFGARIFQFHENWFRHDNGMPRAPSAARLANLVRLHAGEVEQCAERLRSEMRLVSQNDRPMGQLSIPTTPARSALNGTEHAAFGRWIYHTIHTWKVQAIQFRVDRLVTGRPNRGNLSRAQSLPLRHQMSEHRSPAPGQQQFRFSHARRSASGEDEHAEFKPGVSDNIAPLVNRHRPEITIDGAD